MRNVDVTRKPPLFHVRIDRPKCRKVVDGAIAEELAATFHACVAPDAGSPS